MKAELISKKPASSIQSKKTFFRAKKELDVKLIKVQKRATVTSTLKKNPKQKTEFKDSDLITVAALQKPVKEIKSTSKKYKKHKDPEVVLNQAQSAAILPSEKANKSLAHKDQTELMAAQEKGEFNKSDFKAKLKDQINNTIKEKAEAISVASKGVDKKFTEGIDSSLQEQKNKAGGSIEQTTVVSPEEPKIINVGEKTSNEPISLVKENPLTKTFTSQKTALAPAKKTNEESDLTLETKVLDDEYRQNNLSGEKLQKSNEPSFMQADQQKTDSQKKAQELTNQYRNDENKTISETRQGNSMAINGSYNSMLKENSLVKGDTFIFQQNKSKEENQTRQTVSKELDRIFNHTNIIVLGYFSTIDNYIKSIFDEQIKQNLDKYSKRVSGLLDDNDGLEWLGKKLTNQYIQSEIQIFAIAKQEFIQDMQAPIDNLVTVVDNCLFLATKEIKNGKAEVDKYWSTQSDETKKIAGDLYEGTNTKFEELENSVQSKEGSIIDAVVEKFKGALDELDTRFEKAKEENKSWLDRAIDAVKAVIHTIIELKNAIKALAKKAAKYAEQIIDDPITFFGNLCDGVGLGFTNFKKNIDKHLVKGVLEWLTGSMAGSEIVLPKELNVEGITSLVLQILGISIKKIKALVIDIIGKERFEFIEKGVDAGIAAGNKILNLFKILNEKGLEGLWEFIKDEFSNLKEMLIENVKTFVIETITNEAIKTLMLMLVPFAGFVKAAQLLIRFVVTLFQKAAQIIKIIEGIIDSFGEILKKNLSAAAEKVENVLSGFLSLAISFLAAVLGLNGIVGRVQKFIQQKIRPKVDLILNKIAQKIKQVIIKIGLTKLIDKSMKAVEKGEAWVEEKKKKAVEKGKAALGELAEWLGISKSYKSKDGNKHTISFDEVGGKPVMMRSSVKSSFEDYISNVKSKIDEYNAKNPSNTVDFKAIENQYKLIKVEMGKYKDFKKNVVSDKMNTLAELLSQLPDDLSDANVFFPNHNIKARTTYETEYNGSNKSLDGENIDIENLSLKLGSLKGSPGKHTSKLFNHIHNKVSNKQQVIRGHLLNHYLGGSGDTAENIMPIAKSTNDAMERSADNVVKERLAKEKMLTGSVFDYRVSVKYEKSNPLNAIVPGEITMSFCQKQFDTAKEKNKANMEDGDNWKKGKVRPKDSTLDARKELESLI